MGSQGPRHTSPDDSEGRLRERYDETLARLTAALQGSPAFMAVLRGPRHVYEYANDALYDLVGRRELLGRAVAEAIPELAGQRYLEALDGVFATGEPFLGKAVSVAFRRAPGGALEQRFVDFAYQPLRAPDGAIDGVFVHGVDVTERLRDERLLRESEGRFRELADSMPQIVWAARPDGTADYFNRRWHEYTGLPEGAVDDAGWSTALAPEDLPGVAQAWGESVRTGRGYEREVRLRRGSDGALRWHLMRALPVRDLGGAIARWYGSLTDVDDQRRAEAEARARSQRADAERQGVLERERAARAEAELAGRMKDEFLATLSHELRTPLSAILGWSQILRRNAPRPETLAEGLSTIERNARAQTQIVEDLLDMSRIVSGKITLDPQRVDLVAAVRAAVDTVGPGAAAKGIALVLDAHEPAGLLVLGDLNRLQQVFWNLLSNAIKFTPQGGVVRAQVEARQSRWCVDVSDDGEGIDPAFVPYVFDRFRQADASTTRRHGGLGLGLAIVKQLVELHGGRVSARSEGPGTGSTFTVALPMAAPRASSDAGGGRTTARPHAATGSRHPELREGVAWSAATTQLRGATILVVDDEPDARSLLLQLLEDEGARVLVAESAAQAYEAVQRDRPDLLVSDAGMPGEDGLSLLRRIRGLAADRGGDVPAIALTAYAHAEDRAKAIRAGFQVHVPKPVEPAELLRTIDALLGRGVRAPA